jgi:membrane protein implicated in regulation of membrane protease activity
MHWLMLALGVGALAVAMKTSSMLLMVLCLIAALVFILMWVLGLYSARAGARSRDESSMIDPVELRRLREQAEARKLAASQGKPPQPQP